VAVLWNELRRTLEAESVRHLKKALNIEPQSFAFVTPARAFVTQHAGFQHQAQKMKHVN